MQGPLERLPAWHELSRLRRDRRTAWDALLLGFHSLARRIEGGRRHRRWIYSGV